MSDATLTCPHCGQRFPLTEALAEQLRGEVAAALHAQHQAQLQQLATRLGEAQARELQAQRRALELEQAQATAIERERLAIEQKLRAEAEQRLRERLAQERERLREEARNELGPLQAALQETRRQLQQAQAAELALRQKAEAVAARELALDLEVARRLDEKRAEWETQVRGAAVEEQQLKLREKEKQIEGLRRVIDDLKRKSEQGSQELQGEALELDIEAALAAQFPHDVVRPVPKGMHGADLLHEVRNAALAPCGLIVWETKNTRHWQPAWIGKLKDDQRACGATVAVLVSVALPPEARGGLACIDGVWVAGLQVWPALALALREQLLQVAFARNAATGMNEKMEALYRYLAGDAFRHRVEAIVEAFTAMKEQLDRERRAMERLWKEREKQLERVIGATAGMYGELRGTIGQSMPAIAALELDDLALAAPGDGGGEAGA
jgi:hypothetical protein